jgi:hypothetical protein
MFWLYQPRSSKNRFNMSDGEKNYEEEGENTHVKHDETESGSFLRSRGKVVDVSSR